MEMFIDVLDRKAERRHASSSVIAHDNEAPLSGCQGSAAALRNVIDVIHNPLFLCSPVLKNAQAEIESIFYRASRVSHKRREF
jgi:hypothetical protein